MIRQKAFTLIELLIVVAIIAILAAIAVPNFLEAQTRAKVSRAVSDHRALNTAIASYTVDYNQVPWNIKMHPNTGSGVSSTNAGRYLSSGNGWNWYGLPWNLSSPIAYISQADLPDPFAKAGTLDSFSGQVYPNQQTHFYEASHMGNNWVPDYYKGAYSVDNAPDGLGLEGSEGGFHTWTPFRTDPRQSKMGYMLWSLGPDGINGYMARSGNGDIGGGLVYDPTNGTISLGDVGGFYIGGSRVEP